MNSLDIETQNWVLGKLTELINFGFGKLEILVHDHDVKEVNKMEKDRGERLRGQPQARITNGKR